MGLPWFIPVRNQAITEMIELSRVPIVLYNASYKLAKLIFYVGGYRNQNKFRFKIWLALFKIGNFTMQYNKWE